MKGLITAATVQASFWRTIVETAERAARPLPDLFRSRDIWFLVSWFPRTAGSTQSVTNPVFNPTSFVISHLRLMRPC